MTTATAATAATGRAFRITFGTTAGEVRSRDIHGPASLTIEHVADFADGLAALASLYGEDIAVVVVEEV